MIYRVVISHHQAAYLESFRKLFSFVAVFDEMDTFDCVAVRKFGLQDIETVPVSGNRSVNRNAGYLKLSSVAPLALDDIVEFYDGDRVPTLYDPVYVEQTMREHNLGALLYMCPNDTRQSLTGNDFKIVDTGTLINPFYACGFAMTVAAIEHVRAFNNGPLFRPEFTGWGCEDQYLGITCAHLNIRVGLTPKIQLSGAVGGDSDFHAHYRETLQEYINLIRANHLAIKI